MNAIPPIFQAQSGSDAAQLNPAASAASPPARGADQDFAGALRDAGGKPARKTAATKQPDAALSGSALPVPGNQPPPAPVSPAALTPPAPPPAVKTEFLTAQAADIASAAGAITGAAGAVTGLPGGTADADPGAIPATPILTANESSTAALAPNFDLAAPASAPGGDAPGSAAGGDSGNAPVSAANSPPVSVSGLSVPQAPKSLALASAATSTRIPAAPQGSAGDAKSSDGVAGQGTTAPTSSQTSNNVLSDPTLAGAAVTDASAPEQAVMAAAIVQGSSAATTDFSSSSTDLAGAEMVPQGVAAAKDAAAGAPAAALAHASAAASAAVTAATAGRIAQEVLTAAGAGAADKRSHANSPDLSLSGASNDGSAGAAQLLTSNTATDSSPSATFKVAAGVDTAGFGQGVADKVSVMVDSNLTGARLQVNPPALGPIEVRIALQAGHAQVWLSSHSALTRDALESSSPKLREMLGSQGFSQVSVDISHRSFQDRSPPSQAYEAMPSIEGVAPGLAQSPAPMSRSAIGLLDAYA